MLTITTENESMTKVQYILDYLIYTIHVHGDYLLLIEYGLFCAICRIWLSND